MQVSIAHCIAGLVVVASTATAMACPDGQYSSLGMCLPKIGGTVGHVFEKTKIEAKAQLEGAALEKWIIASRNSSVGTSQPIPPQIRQALTGYIDEEIMNRARFKVGDNGVLNLANLTLTYGDAAAITLQDVIVFKNANDAYNDPSLWAHELTHVRQYRDWGTHAFSIRYARDHDAVEREAYAVGDGYAAWASTRGGLQQVSQPSGQPFPQPFGQPFPQTFGQPPIGVFCQTMQGRFGPGPAAPLGTPCNIQMPYGVLVGQISY